MRFRADIARTLGDLLLDHIYTRAGGKRPAIVTIQPERAATILSGDARPGFAEVSVLRDMLYALAADKPRAYRVTRSAHTTGAFDIQPTDTRSTLP